MIPFSELKEKTYFKWTRCGTGTPIPYLKIPISAVRIQQGEWVMVNSLNLLTRGFERLQDDEMVQPIILVGNKRTACRDSSGIMVEPVAHSFSDDIGEITGVILGGCNGFTHAFHGEVNPPRRMTRPTAKRILHHLLCERAAHN